MDAVTKPMPIIGLQILGEPEVAACEGDFCAVPEHHTHAVVNRRIDEGSI